MGLLGSFLMTKLDLTNVTMVSVNCVNPIQSVKALLYSSRDIDFAEMLLISNKKPDNLPESIRFVETQQTTWQEGNLVAYRTLPDLIETDYYLGIHDDGFVINPHLWENEFFEYDYIGAPWKDEGQRNRVGNGGFVLKSKKFIDLCRYIEYLGKHDDGELTNYYYDYFIQNGCKYAPVEVAMRFSLESKIPECEYNLDNCFGFHGRGVVDAVHDGEGQQFKDRIKLLEEIEL